MSEPSHLITDINMELHQRPTIFSAFYSCCRNHTLGPLLQCKANGREIRNWARCVLAANTVWYSPLTNIVDIPDDIQVRFAAKLSLAEAQQQNPAAHIPCAAPNCLNTNNQPRRANKECGRTPFYCSTCCKASGGCSAHRLTARDAPSVRISASTTDAPSSNIAPQRLFARPLDSNYARGYALGHRHLFEANAKVEEDAKITEVENNIFDAVVWSKNAPVQPERFRLVAHNQRFVVSNSPAIAAFSQNGFLSILHSTVPPSWLNHDIRIPIQVSLNSCSLLKAPDVTDCTQLEDEISRLPPSPVPPITLTSTSLALPASAVDDPDSEIVFLESSPESFAGKRFPLEFTCDMADGMAVLASTKGKKSLEKAFETVFPNLAFKAPTVYKHIAFYSEELKSGLFQKLAAFGRKPAGTWKVFVSEIKAAQVTKKMAKPTVPRVIDLTGQFHSMETLDPPPVQNTILYDDNLVFHCAKQTLDVEVIVSGLLVDVATDFFSLAQPWYNGDRLAVTFLGLNGAYIQEILTCFSHYTYEASAQNSVYVDFDGIWTGTGYRILDSRTHVRDVTQVPGGCDVEGSLGEQGVRTLRCCVHSVTSESHSPCAPDLVHFQQPGQGSSGYYVSLNPMRCPLPTHTLLHSFRHFDAT